MKFTRRESHRCAVFLLTYFCYAMFHSTRHAFSNVKTSTEKIWTPTEHNESYPELQPHEIWNSRRLFHTQKDAERFQGVLDTSFMLAYSFGLFLSGFIGDRVNMRYLLSIGTAGLSVTVFLFGCVCEWTHFYNEYFYVFLWIVNGFMQSTGWPVVVACMGNWFGKDSRGVLLGIWSSCASVGNILGALMVASVLSYGYQYTFLLTSCMSFSASILVFFGLVPSPEDVGMEKPKEDEDDETPEFDSKTQENGNIKETSFNDKFKHGDSNDHKEHTLENGSKVHEQSNGSCIKKHENGETLSNGTLSKNSQAVNGNAVRSDDNRIDYDIQTTKPASINFFKAFLLPGVIAYSLAYAFLKLVNYSFFFWLPFYLNNALHFVEGEAAKLSTVYDVAGIVGGSVVGFVSDRVGKRTVLIVPMLLLSIPTLLIYSHSPDNYVANIALMFLVGFFIAGAANLISAAVSADLGCQKQLRGDDKALATVTGVIDGTGSLGAALGQIAVPYLQTGFDWHAVFYLFMVCMFLTSVCLFPLFIKELRSLKCCSWCKRSQRKYDFQNPASGSTGL